MKKLINKTSDPKAEAGSKKIGFDHVPIGLFLAGAYGMRPGVPKYGSKNWYDTESLNYNVYLNGQMRHLLLLMAGEDYVRDVDGFVHHQQAIISGGAVFEDVRIMKKLNDDRVIMTDEALNEYARLICGEEYANLPIKRKEQ